jgi:AraC family transcriptional regulator of adaptative response/methylated-DNA-[protein]-cysteine methyltransferase
MMTAVDPRWDAVRERRPDHSFVFGVRTTRIACRPGCPSRTPSPENVLYFEDFNQAQRAGFRACKRCAPDDIAADAERRRSIERACEWLADDDAPSIDDAAQRSGMSRFHFQRIFRDVVGVSPGDYRRAARDERFRALLQSGESVTTAMHEAGFGSSSRAYEARTLGMTPSSFRSGARGEQIRFAIADCTLGRVLVAATGRGICAIELGDNDESVLAHLRRHFPHAHIERADGDLREHIHQVVALVDSPDGGGSLPLDIRGTAFQRKIWNALREVPPGKRVTYEELAAAAGRPGAAQAAGSACGANKLAIAIPCHRAVRKDGALAGYRWGLDRKERLLEREK